MSKHWFIVFLLMLMVMSLFSKEKLVVVDKHYILTARIVEHYANRGYLLKFNVTLKALKDIEFATKTIFPEGTFKYTDILTLAMIESDFTPHLKGKAGEMGMFQILKWQKMCKRMGFDEEDIYDTRVNALIGCRILKDKYNQQKDYKRAIIAYNGLVIKDNKIRVKYWNRFVKAKKVIDGLMEGLDL